MHMAMSHLLRSLKPYNSETHKAKILARAARRAAAEANRVAAEAKRDADRAAAEANRVATKAKRDAKLEMDRMARIARGEDASNNEALSAPAASAKQNSSIRLISRTLDKFGSLGMAAVSFGKKKKTVRAKKPDSVMKTARPMKTARAKKMNM